MIFSKAVLAHLDYLNTLESSTEVATLEKLINLCSELDHATNMHTPSEFEDSKAFISRVLNSDPNTFSESDIVHLKIISKVAQCRIEHIKNINRLRKSERIFRLTFEQMGSGMCQTDLEGYILDANEKFFEIIGYTREEALGLRIRDLTQPEDWEIDADYKEQLFRYEIPYFSMQKRYLRKDGSMIWVYTTVTLMRGDAVEDDFLIGVVQDISSQKAAEDLMRDYTENLERQIQLRTSELEALNKQLQEADRSKDLVIKELKEVKEKLLLSSNIDPLTGLYNRRYMMDRISEEVNRYRRNKTPFCIMVADIDYFKEINDRFGHDCGDEVLQTISNLINAEIRNIDTLSRWGGEEFLILLPETQIYSARSVAERIRQSILKNVFAYENATFHLTMTFGLATYENDQTIKETIKKADNALYQGKLAGRNRII